jgi:hypothetical protein
LDCRGSFILAVIRYKTLQWTIVFTIFCPPGPLPFKKASVNSSSGKGGGRSGIFFFIFHDEDVKARCAGNSAATSLTNGIHLMRDAKTRSIAHCAPIST